MMTVILLSVIMMTVMAPTSVVLISENFSLCNYSSKIIIWSV